MVELRIAMNHEIDIETACDSPALLKLKNILEDIKCECSRTAKLWLTYMDYIYTLKLFIRAERVVNWNMHIIAVGRMLNLFAATGHFNYAKSAHMYLQLMLELQVCRGARSHDPCHRTCTQNQ